MPEDKTKCSGCGKSLIGVMTYSGNLCNNCYAKKPKKAAGSSGAKTIRSHEVWFVILLMVSTLGVIDLGTESYVFENFGIKDMGVISFLMGLPYGYIFGSKIAAIVMTAIRLLSRITIFWIGLTIYEWFCLNKLRN
jgi:hypothetical protein